MSDGNHDWYGDDVQFGDFDHPTYTCIDCGADYIQKRDQRSCCS